MSGFKEPGFADRQKAAQQAKQNLLNKFRAQPGHDDPEVAKRRAERQAIIANRERARQGREAAKAEQKRREEEAATAEAARIAREQQEAIARQALRCPQGPRQEEKVTGSRWVCTARFTPSRWSPVIPKPCSAIPARRVIAKPAMVENPGEPRIYASRQFFFIPSSFFMESLDMLSLDMLSLDIESFDMLSFFML